MGIGFCVLLDGVSTGVCTRLNTVLPFEMTLQWRQTHTEQPKTAEKKKNFLTSLMCLSPAVCSKAATYSLLLAVSQFFMSDLSKIHGLLADSCSLPTAAELQRHH